MADWLQWLGLALIQGLTEFLPISSSAHLILLSYFAGWEKQGLLVDIAAHFGSLLAVLLYFRKDIIEVLLGRDKTLFLYLNVSAIPLAIAGLLLADFVDSQLRTPLIIALASAVLGVALYLSQKKAVNQNLNWRIVTYMSLAQVLALIPGASRSGVTMTAGMWAGLSKEKAASFSFLMAIPAILMTTAYGALKWYQNPAEQNIPMMLTVMTLSFVAAYACIHFFMKLIKRIDFIWFMHYRLILAALILMTI
ncbi:undecaprenyl-diphosphate phosphatase [Marinicella rhabdoformis]|uniref:undecaprenyl-diphosphate phosphatase n=1 Tax=Marinicella rhabdoformis TaxID=2580566 RepID=UPI0012AEDC96|nr:undecaprenyl-diphosphate phosphatase [Marinicella rhabdoformis]